MLDPADDQFSDNSLADLAEPNWAAAPTQASMSDRRPPASTESQLSPEQAMRKAGSVVPGFDGTGALQVGTVQLTPASGSYTPFLIAAVGALAGGMYAGWWGVAAGALAGGAAINANRWRKGGPSKSADGLFALATMGGAVYAGYKAHQYRKKTSPEPSREPDVLELDEDDQIESNSTKPARRSWLRPVRR
jgi:hypothetical protein